IELYSRARLFEEIAEGKMPGFIPHPDNPQIAWLPVQAILSAESDEVLFNFFPQENVQKVKEMLSHFLARAGEDDLRLAIPSATFFAASLNELLKSRHILLDNAHLPAELLYLHLK